MPRSQRNSGFTLIEMTITTALMTVVLGVMVDLVRNANALFESNSLISNVDTLAVRSLDRLARDLQAAAPTTFLPTLQTPAGNPTVWSSSLDFRYAIGWNSATRTANLGPTQRILLQLASGELDNGLDDNGNGLIDERSLILIENLGQPNERTRVLANGVSELLDGELPNGIDDNGNGLIDESGFSLDLASGTLNMRLCIGRSGSGGEIVTRTHSDSIHLRN